MAAAALLRSVGRKMARAPPARRPFLARGGADLGHGGSLPPLTCNGAASVAGIRSLVTEIAHAPPLTSNMAAAVLGIRSLATKITHAPPLTSNGAAAVAGIRSLATKTVHAPRPHHQLLHTSPNPAFASPPTGGKRDFITTLRKFRAGMAYFTVALVTIHMYVHGWPAPEEDKALIAKFEELSRKRTEINDTIQVITDDLKGMNVQVQNMLAYSSKVVRSEDEKKHDDDAVYRYEDACKELKDVIKDIQAMIVERKG